MREYSKREQFANNVTTLLRFCACKGYGVTFGETWRTKIQQLIYSEMGMSKVKVSQHQKKLAIDLHIWDKDNGGIYITDEQWREVGHVWESLNPLNRWGGRFGLDHKDYPVKVGWDRWHFERRD